LQYTSGSTGTPRGVIVRHENLLANSAFIHRGFEHSSESHSVSWLPPYHDMGLIGGILQALYGGFPTTLMSPISFLERPLRWLRAISTFRANASGGPNFAYDLCVRRLKPDDLAGLDLASWTIAFCGAEPIRPATLERFSTAFAPARFSRAALYPCYGLAEATLAVTLSEKGAGFCARAFDARELERHAVCELDSDAAAVSGDATWLVGSGRPAADHEVIIVAPETSERCPPGQVGEIWVRGASVASGYWKRPAESDHAFGARLIDGSGPFLRTGDLGFLLIGVNAREWGLFQRLGAANPNNREKLARTVSATFGDKANQVSKQYPVANDEEASEVYLRLVTDAAFRCPTRNLAQLASRHGASVFLYSFEQGNALHAQDLDYVFGDNVMSYYYDAQPPSAAPTASVQRYWRRFALLGDPNGKGDAAWPRYQLETDRHLVLVDPPREARGLARAHCEFWREYFEHGGTIDLH
jgi:hypothetical protein